ncbi:MAG: ATP-binding cassette domain-containing protein [Dehalococcoidales bacterium]|nr:ATP-binding cassette domain-containing protein [Dehalococcoidales bacterium]
MTFTVFHHILYSIISYRRHFKEICDEALDLFPDIKPHLNDKSATLSGGEAQMVELAMAVVRRPRPRLLLIDEPSTGLSPENVHRFAEKIRTLKGETTVVIVEQVIHAAIKIADKYAVIRDGKILHQDRVCDIEKDEDTVQKCILG